MLYVRRNEKKKEKKRRRFQCDDIYIYNTVVGEDNASFSAIIPEENIMIIFSQELSFRSNIVIA